MIELPTTPIEAIQKDPRFIILFGKPKCGKTTIASLLPNNLLIDLEDGSDFVSGMKVKATTVESLRDIIIALQKSEHQYDFITLDTATILEDVILPLANQLYRATPMGKSWEIDKKTGLPNPNADVKTLPQGGGYLYVREAYKKIINSFTPYPKKALILLGHSADKLIDKDGKELSTMEIDLTGKLKRLIPAKADALGYVYRKKNKTIISFEGGDNTVVEARPEHLRGKSIIVAESDEDNKITAHWERIFTSLL